MQINSHSELGVAGPGAANVLVSMEICLQDKHRGGPFIVIPPLALGSARLNRNHWVVSAVRTGYGDRKYRTRWD